MRDRLRTALLAATWVALTIVTPASAAAASQDDPDGFTPPEGLDVGWYARIETSMGSILARLLPQQAPQSVAHFAALAQGRLEWFDRTTGELQKAPYYDGIEVHKALAGRHFEAGDSRRAGGGTPDVLVPLEGVGPVDFSAPGRLGMTREGSRISGVIFFATAAGEPWLNGRHPCFGQIVSGLHVVENISQVETYSNDRPVDPPLIEKIRVFAVGEPAALPEPVAYRPRRVDFEARPGMRKSEPD